MEYSTHSKCNVKLTKFTLWTHVNCVNEETLKHQKTTFLSEGTSHASGMSCNRENCLLSLLLSFLSGFVDFCIHLTLCKLPSIYGEVGPPHLYMPMLKTGPQKYPHSHSGDFACRDLIRTRKRRSFLSWQKYSRIQNSVHNLFTVHLLKSL
jgi:hypothetical protein